jgi:hypothetical protein
MLTLGQPVQRHFAVIEITINTEKMTIQTGSDNERSTTATERVKYETLNPEAG